MTKKEFSKTETRIRGALSKVDEFLQNPRVRVQSRTIPGTSVNMNVENQQPTGDRFQNDPPLNPWIQTLRRHPTPAFFEIMLESSV